MKTLSEMTTGHIIIEAIILIIGIILFVYFLYSIADVIFHLLPDNLQEEIKKAISTKLLSYVFDILPDGEFKTLYSEFISNNIFKL